MTSSSLDITSGNSGLVRDIGIGANGAAWVIGKNPTPGGYGVHYWTGTGWQGIDGGAESIAVDAQGRPWVVNNAGKIFRRDGNGWIGLPGLAKDIGIGANGTVWVVGREPNPGGYGAHYWTGSGWQGIGGGVERIAGDPQGRPWAVNNVGNIFTWSV